MNKRALRMIGMLMLAALLMITEVCAAEGNAFSDVTRWIPVSSGPDGTLYVAADVYSAMPYDENRGDWENSDLRAWLNGEYLNAVLTAEERAALLPVDETGDLVSLCSVDQLPEAQYMQARGPADGMLWTDPALGTCWWWLRDMGGSTSRAAFVNEKGEVNPGGTVVWDDTVGVRPLVRAAAGFAAETAEDPAVGVTTGSVREVVIVTIDSNVRSAASADAERAGYAYKGNAFPLIAREGDYYVIQLENGTHGYIRTDRCDLARYTERPAAVSEENCIGTVRAIYDSNVREGNSQFSGKVGYLYTGMECSVYGSENGWYLVKLADGTIGWISGTLCQLIPGP
ncbi:MAG: SH3 domain-containing protein [Clostridia bacterium]|nr:SH3 domain-containing protein [Clostridia bacterium]